MPFIDWAPIGPRFSNAVLQTLLVLFARRPPKVSRFLHASSDSDIAPSGSATPSHSNILPPTSPHRNWAFRSI
jgi:hypothetical protein